MIPRLVLGLATVVAVLVGAGPRREALGRPRKPLAGGPPGYRCTTNNPKGRLASQGSCQKGAASVFTWAPKVA